MQRETVLTPMQIAARLSPLLAGLVGLLLGVLLPDGARPWARLVVGLAVAAATVGFIISLYSRVFRARAASESSPRA